MRNGFRVKVRVLCVGCVYMCGFVDVDVACKVQAFGPFSVSYPRGFSVSAKCPVIPYNPSQIHT